MSEPVKLQQRLSAEFSPGQTREDRASVPEPPSLEPDLDTGPQPEPEGHATARSIVAGVGLLCSALVLATGFAAGFYIAATGLALAGVAGAYFLFQGRKAGRISETARDRAWERNETSEILSAIHDVLGDIVVMRSMDGRILRGNAVLAQLTGSRDVEGQTCAELGLVFRSQSTPHRYDVEIDGEMGLKTFSWHDITVRDPLTGDLVVHSIARDVTEDRQAEKDREAARQKAESASEAKSRLLATVSHEIRTPLSGILGMSHLISQTRLTAEQKNYLSGIRQSGHALVQLVDDLLDFSTIEAGRFQLRPSEEPLRPLLESVVEMLSPRAHDKGIEIGSFVAPDVPSLVTCDAPRLRQVLYNVIGNAVKFTHIGGVSVETKIENGALVVAVSDTGPGMNAEEQARIFEEFEQAGGAAQRSGGTGLGLAISAHILREAGGELTLTSEIGKGSRFLIRMPVNLRTEAGRASRFGMLRGNTVFLFAPTGPAAASLKRTISGLGGTCHHASTVEEALDLTQRLAASGKKLTDIIVDNRLSGQFRRELADRGDFADRQIRRTYLVNPEERTGRAIGNGEGYDAWLIRPLRQRSLVEVLRGRMKGIEVRDAINDNRPELKELPAERQTEPSRKKGEIVLAEDDPVNAMLVRSMLVKAGFDVTPVDDFPALIARMAETGRPSPVAIITDFNMPGGEGLDVLARIRAGERDGGREALPIVVLTADTRLALRQKLLAAGADTVLAKPADPQTLIAALSRLSPAARRSE
jgi:signal transduction histidine kinase/CheY-like chemotaxis protein